MEQIAQDVRSTAIDRGKGRVWVEKVKIRTRAPRASLDRTVDGPLLEIDRLLRELKEDDRKLVEFARRELGELAKKLPPELKSSDAINLDGPEWFRGLLDEVRPLLAGHFDVLGRGR
jgi:hypothetical protein